VINTDEGRQTSTARDWSVWGWLGLLVVVAVHALVMFIASALVALDTQGMCRESATPGDLVDARVALLVVVTLALGPWLAATLVAHLRRRPWVRFMASGLVVAFFPACYLVSALGAAPADWSSDWCLF
jgi:hypothetical protein